MADRRTEPSRLSGGVREWERPGGQKSSSLLSEAAAEVLADGGEGGGDDQVVERGDDSGHAGHDRGPDGTASRTGCL
jgi:hypothetical protein